MQKGDLRVQLQGTLGDDYELEHELQGGMREHPRFPELLERAGVNQAGAIAP